MIAVTVVCTAQEQDREGREKAKLNSTHLLAAKAMTVQSLAIDDMRNRS